MKGNWRIIYSVKVAISSLFLLFPLMVRAGQTAILTPTADGQFESVNWDAQGITPCTTAQCNTYIDEASGSACNGEADDDTTYLSSNTIDAVQTFRIDLSTVPDNAIILAVDITACARRAQTNAAYKTTSCINGICTDAAETITPTVSYQTHAQLHPLNATKTPTTVLEIGMKNLATRTLRVSKLDAQVIYYLPTAGGGGGGSRVLTLPPLTVQEVTHKQGNGKKFIVHFITNREAKARIVYSEDGQEWKKDVLEDKFAIEHDVEIEALDTEKLVYHYKIFATDPLGNSVESEEQIIHLSPPLVLNERAVTPTKKSIVIVWDTDEGATGEVEWGRTGALGNKVTAKSSGTTHEAELTDLLPDTIYYYRLIATDAVGNITQTEIRTLQTSPRCSNGCVLPSLNPVLQVQDSGLVVQWDSPYTAGYGSVVLRKTAQEQGKYITTIMYAGAEKTFFDPVISTGKVEYELTAMDKFNEFVRKETVAYELPDKPLFTAVTVLEPGDTGEVVTRLQMQLQQYGFLRKKVKKGIFDQITKEAVKIFQNQIHALPNGIVSAFQQRILGSGAITYAYQPFMTNRMYGENGADITDLQNLLIDLGYFPHDVRATGYFGSVTRRTIKLFQQMNGVQQTGKLDQAMISTINGILKNNSALLINN